MPKVPLAVQGERELVNEARKLERAEKRLLQKVDAFRRSKPLVRPFRYVLNFDIDVSSGEEVIGLYPQQEQSFVVRQGSVFFAQGMTFSFRAEGVLTANNEAAVLSYGSGAWPELFQFDWSVKDTGAFAREWQNTPLPGNILMSNAVNPLLFGNGHCRLEPGTTVELTVIPRVVTLQSGGLNDLFASLSSYKLEFSFIGEEFREAA